MSDATQQALLPIFLTWGLPFGVSLAAVSYSLSCTGWSTLRLEAILATSKLSDVRYTQIAPAAVFVYRITCLSPLTFLVLLGVDIMRKFQGSTTLGACILLVGPSLLLLGWAALRSRFCKWHVSWWVLVAATVGAAGLLAAQLAFAIVPSTPFLSFSAVFLGLSAMPIVFISELGIEPGRAPLLLSLRAVSDKEAALVPIDWQRLVSTGFAAYMIITAAYVGVGAMRQDVAPYAAGAAAACVLVFDVLALALHFQGAIRGARGLVLLCSIQRLVFVAFGPNYIDEGEAVVFLLVGFFATHRLIRRRWVRPPASPLDKYLTELVSADAPTSHEGTLLTRLLPFTLELFTAAVCVAHLGLLLVLVYLLPTEALPPARILGSQHPQPLSGLLALSVLASLAATDALLYHFMVRGRRPRLAWLAWWCFVVGVAALVDTLLIRSFGLLVFTAFAGPILLTALHGHRIWAEDAYCFVESWAEIKLAWNASASTEAGGTSVDAQKGTIVQEDVELVSACESAPPSPPPSPTSAAEEGAANSPSASQVGHGPTLSAVDDSSDALRACSAAVRRWARASIECSHRAVRRVQASRVLQRLILSGLLGLLHLGLGATLSIYVGSVGWAVAMGLSVCFLLGMATLSAYHQPQRHILPRLCVLLALCLHVAFCFLFWQLVLLVPEHEQAAISDPGSGEGSSGGEEGSGFTDATPNSAQLLPTSGTGLLLYAAGAPTATALAGLLWLWYDSGWRLIRPVKVGMAMLGGLLLVFIALIAIFYSWQVAAGLLLTAITLTASSVAAVTWRANGGYLPRSWHMGLGGLMAGLAIVGAVIALINPSGDELSAVNGFLGCSLSWWTCLLVVWAAGFAAGQPTRGESYRYYHCLTAVPSFRFMGSDQPLQCADATIVLFSMAAMGAIAWSAIAAVAFEPAGLGVCVGLAIELVWLSHMVRCAVAPLTEMGRLAPFVNTELLQAAASAVSAATRMTTTVGGAVAGNNDGVDVADGNQGGEGGEGELAELIAARSTAQEGLAAAVAARKAAQAKLGWLKGCGCKRLPLTEVGGAPDVGGEAGSDVESGGGLETSSISTTVETTSPGGSGPAAVAATDCCGLSEEAMARRRAAGELPRLDDAVASAWSAQIQVAAKFHAALVSLAADAQTDHERGVQAFVRDQLRQRGGSEQGALDEAALDAMLSLDRLRRLKPPRRAALERAAEAEQRRRADEQRKRELEAAKQQALYAAQEQLRQQRGRREAMVERTKRSWKEALEEAAAPLEAAQSAVSAELPTARAVAEAIEAEIAALSAMGEAAECAEQHALAHATGGAASELKAMSAKIAALDAHADGQCRPAEILARVSAEVEGWAPPAEAVQASTERLRPELRGDEEVRTAHAELLGVAELCQRAEALAKEGLAAARAALNGEALALRDELRGMHASMDDALAKLDRERVRLAAAVEAAMLRQAESERRAVEERRQREEAERRKRREHEAAEAEAARARELEEARRRKAQRDSRTPAEQAMAEEVEPRLAEVRRTGQPYTDPDFPPSGTRLLPPSVRGQRGVGWTRAQRIYGSRETITLFGDDGEPEPDEILQGGAGDCWFLSALSILALRPDLVKRILVTPDVLPLVEGGESSGRGGEGAGLFCVVFHKDGRWRPVVVDDYFPTDWRGHHLFARSRGSELWVSVLEKAYASLHGSYTAIEGGWIEEALCDLTGGIKINGPKIEPAAHASLTAAWKELQELAAAGTYLLGASTCRAPDGGGDTHSTRGIVHGHAYALLHVVEVQPEGVRLLKLRNPWGQTEWEGRYGDADMARPANARLRKKLDWVKSDDGAFYMSFDDFVQYFVSVSICMLPEGFGRPATVRGAWAGTSAGGCPNFETTANNPQFILSITRPTDIVLTLTQTDRRVGAGQDDWSHASIGMYVCSTARGVGSRGSGRLRSRHEVHRNRVAGTKTFSHSREATIKCSLDMREHGTTRYVLLPCTFDPGVEAEFTIRAFVAEGQPAVGLEAVPA